MSLIFLFVVYAGCDHELFRSLALSRGHSQEDVEAFLEEYEWDTRS